MMEYCGGGAVCGRGGEGGEFRKIAIRVDGAEIGRKSAQGRGGRGRGRCGGKRRRKGN